MLIANITSYSEFQFYINKYKFIIINISASWCKPCNNIKPNIEKFVSVINDDFIYLKIDNSVYDDDSLFHQFFNMKKIPYFGFVKNGKLIDHIVSGDFDTVSKKIFNHVNNIRIEEKNIFNDTFIEYNDF